MSLNAFKRNYIKYKYKQYHPLIQIYIQYINNVVMCTFIYTMYAKHCKLSPKKI